MLLDVVLRKTREEGSSCQKKVDEVLEGLWNRVMGDNAVEWRGTARVLSL